MKRWWLVPLILALAAVARADDPLAKPADAVARDYLQQGNRFYHLHDLGRALDAYKAGSLRDDSPVFLYNLAQCHRQLGNYAESIWHYERFVARARPSGELRVSIDRFVHDMKVELGRPLAVEQIEPWYDDATGWVLAGAGVIATTAASYLVVESWDLDDQANGELRQSVRDGLRDRADTRRGIGAIAGTAGVGLLVAGIIKLAIRSTSWSFAPAGRGVTAMVRF